MLLNQKKQRPKIFTAFLTALCSIPVIAMFMGNTYTINPIINSSAQMQFVSSFTISSSNTSNDYLLSEVNSYVGVAYTVDVTIVSTSSAFTSLSLSWLYSSWETVSVDLTQYTWTALSSPMSSYKSINVTFTLPAERVTGSVDTALPYITISYPSATSTLMGYLIINLRDTADTYNTGYNAGYDFGYSVGLSATQDVGAKLMMVDSLNAFLNLEIFPSFHVYTLLILALGLALFGLFLKTFLGG